jgi:hypothetical protein
VHAPLTAQAVENLPNRSRLADRPKDASPSQSMDQAPSRITPTRPREGLTRRRSPFQLPARAACEELRRRELEIDDPQNPVVMTVRATKAERAE